MKHQRNTDRMSFLITSITHKSHNIITVKPVFFTCPLFREFREPDKFAKITGRENLNTVAFQCSRKQKRQNYGVRIIKLTQTPKLRVAKIKGFTVHCDSGQHKPGSMAYTLKQTLI